MEKYKKSNFLLIAILLFIILLTSCTDHKKQLEVTATAYNSLPGQTSGDPSVTAWGDTLEPGMKAIAISRDLLDSGLYYGARVRIEGLPGTFIVRDKMNKRWNNKIDIYFGESVEQAHEWGKKQVTIEWRPE